MKILITGANGTVGQLLNLHLAPWHTVTALQGRQDLNLMDLQAVNKFFTGHHYDRVIHCAVAGADNTNSMDFSIMHTNLTMWENLRAQHKSFDRLINLASGCELGYGSERSEHELFTSYPKTPYGMSKNLIARSVLEHTDWYNLRLYGIIANTRVFKALWDAVDADRTVFDVVDDKYMDYITEGHLASIVRYYVEAQYTLPQDINMVYTTKYKVSEVLQRYIEDNGINIELNILNTADPACNYTGSGYKLAEVNIL